MQYFTITKVFAGLSIMCTLASGVALPAADPSLSMKALSSRGDPTSCCPVAAWNWGVVGWDDARAAIDHIKSLNSLTYVNPNSCTLAQCMNGVGIQACVENSNLRWSFDGSLLADYASAIFNECADFQVNGGTFCGQRFSPTQPWNIIVNSC